MPRQVSIIFPILGKFKTAKRVFLMPDQLSMEQATGSLVSSALQKIALPENEEPKDEKTLKKYR